MECLTHAGGNGGEGTPGSGLERSLSACRSVLTADESTSCPTVSRRGSCLVPTQFLWRNCKLAAGCASITFQVFCNCKCGSRDQMCVQASQKFGARWLRMCCWNYLDSAEVELPSHVHPASSTQRLLPVSSAMPQRRNICNVDNKEKGRSLSR